MGKIADFKLTIITHEDGTVVGWPENACTGIVCQSDSIEQLIEDISISYKAVLLHSLKNGLHNIFTEEEWKKQLQK